MEIKPNSHKYREEQQDKKDDIKPIVTGNVHVKKEGIGQKFSNTFLADNVKNVSSYVVSDVLIPAVIDTIVDGLTSAINMLFKGDPTPRRKTSGGKTNYSSYSRSSSSKYDREDRRRVTKDRYGMMNVSFDSRGDAIEVRDCMMEIIDKYHLITVAEYYDLCGIADQAKYTDNNYGWDDLDDISISRDRDGYHLDLPRPEALN